MVFEGICFSEFWKRENLRLAYEWNVSQVEEDEADLAEYTKRTNETTERIEKTNNQVLKAILVHQRKIKSIISTVVLLVSVSFEPEKTQTRLKDI